MLTLRILLFAALVSSGSILPAAQRAPSPIEADIFLGFVHIETIAVGVTGEGHHKSGIVVRVTNQKNKVDSFGISNEAGVLIEPLPPGEYCYEAFSDAGRHLKMNRPAVERCFEVQAGKGVEVGVEFKQ
jgi:hypothetical protein